jgi:hypothetical protein
LSLGQRELLSGLEKDPENKKNQIRRKVDEVGSGKCSDKKRK